MDRRSFIKGSSGVVVLSAAVRPAQAHTVPPVPQLKVTWLGGATMQITFNDFTLLTDPCFGDGEKAFIMGDPNEMFELDKGPTVKPHRRITPFPRAVLKHPDQVVLSHAHEDHFDQAAAAELRPGIPFLLPPHDYEKISAMGFTALDPMGWGDTRIFHAGSGAIKVTALPAEHSITPRIARLLGKGNGYWIEVSQGGWRRTIYWTGDTFGTQPVVEAVTSFEAPDLMIAHMGGVGSTGPLGKISMEADDVVPFAALIKPKHLLAIHHSTYALYLEPISELLRKNVEGGLPLDVIASGTTLIIE